jgi:hypothetical protein
MSFLIPAAAAAVGSWLTGKSQAKKNNKQNAYQVDQARRDYEAKRALEEEQDTRRLDGVDFLQSIAQAKGYNIPPGAFEALKRRGAYRGMSATDRIADAPKEGASVLGALGAGLGTYGSLAGQAALNHSARGLLPERSSASPTWDGGAGGDEQSILDYYRSLLPGNDEVNTSMLNLPDGMLPGNSVPLGGRR